MTLLVDTGPMVALADRRDRLQPVVERLLRDEPGQLILPAPVSAEVDYLLGQRLGRSARRAFLADLAAGRFRVVCLDDADYAVAERYDAQYADLDVGLADLSIAILAARFRTHRILTFDQRHFRALRPLDGGVFVVLPADERV
ncbi:MAG: PIN domain-containing protein [Chloroflexi bacterium]|nr:PIN domain-containing protein [Chloroflexota bacterium]